MTTKIERKIFNCSDLNMRAQSDDTPEMLVGHAAVFNTEARINGFFSSFDEIIAPGAFTRSIAENDDVRALFNHDASMVLGRTKSGTLRLSEDEIGLMSEIDVPDTQLGRDVTELIRRGDISQMSFGFIVRAEKIEEREDNVPVRTVLEADLFDVSPVTFPAFPETDIDVKRDWRSADDIWTESIQSELTRYKVESYQKRAILARLALRKSFDKIRLMSIK